MIPCKVTGKFSIRLVPDMKPDDVFNLVNTYVKKIWAKRGSPNNFK